MKKKLFLLWTETENGLQHSLKEGVQPPVEQMEFDTLQAAMSEATKVMAETTLKPISSLDFNPTDSECRKHRCALVVVEQTIDDEGEEDLLVLWQSGDYWIN